MPQVLACLPWQVLPLSPKERSCRRINVVPSEGMIVSSEGTDVTWEETDVPSQGKSIVGVTFPVAGRRRGRHGAVSGIVPAGQGVGSLPGNDRSVGKRGYRAYVGM